jgi:lipoyl(octanoyl) transferase
MTNCWTIDLGLVPYAEAYALQKRIVAARKAGAIDDALLLCEHPHVITQGRNGKREHLLASQHFLDRNNVAYFETSRGGDITYHGPGQILGYPILHLAAIRRDVVWYVRMLEEVMIRATADFALGSYRVPGKTGIWVEAGTSEEKLGAIGVHLSRWVTSHGFAYNVATDLRYFDLIVPCGIADRKATSLEKALGRAVLLEEVRPSLARHFADVFRLQLVSLSRAALLQKLEAFEQTELRGVAVPLETVAEQSTQECLSQRSAG